MARAVERLTDAELNDELFEVGVLIQQAAEENRRRWNVGQPQQPASELLAYERRLLDEFAVRHGARPIDEIMAEVQGAHD
jgi:hypothetical protein